MPNELGVALRALAESRGETVSNVVTEAIALQLRLTALDLALADADRRFGPIPAHLVSKAASELVAASRPGRRRKARPRGK